MEGVFHQNYAYIRDRRTWTDTLSACLYHSAAAEYRYSHNQPPTPDELAGMHEAITGTDSFMQATPGFAAFCLAFSEAYGGELANFGESETEPERPRIAYLQNAFSDRAYRHFSGRFERVSALYFPGFREICEEVYNGNCSYALLPIYNSRDGQLVSFRRLISKYDLKISLVTDVETTDDSIMRFALLQKGIDRYAAQNHPCMDLSVVLEDASLGTFLSACESLGAVVRMLHSMPLEYSYDGNGLLLQLDICHASRDALFCFLEGSHIRYEILGIYDILRS